MFGKDWGAGGHNEYGGVQVYIYRYNVVTAVYARVFITKRLLEDIAKE